MGEQEGRDATRRREEKLAGHEQEDAERRSGRRRQQAKTAAHVRYTRVKLAVVRTLTRLKPHHWVSSVLSILLLTVTATYTGVSCRQWEVMSGQLAANRAALRPFLTVTIVDSPTFEPRDDPMKQFLTLRVTNRGGGGAANVAMNFVPALIDQNKRHLPTFMFVGIVNPFLNAKQQIGPGEFMEYPIGMVPPAPNVMKAWENDGRAIRAYGRLSYCDPFMERRAQPFCMESSTSLGRRMVVPCVTPREAIDQLDLQEKNARDQRGGQDEKCDE